MAKAFFAELWGVRQLIWMTRTTLPTEMWGVFFYAKIQSIRKKKNC